MVWKSHFNGSVCREWGFELKKPQGVLSGTLKREFQKDLEFFKHFLLMLNDAGPIRNVELMWNEDLDPMKPKFKNRVTTGDALIQLQTAGNQLSNRNSPSTLFCDLVHGFGAHEEETCAHSDVPVSILLVSRPGNTLT